MSKLYSKLLATKGHGHPLYIPEPNENLPYEYRQQGISIGDVGIITSDGEFDFLFNACLPATHPINENNVPRSFSPLVLQRRDISRQSQRHSPGTVISTGHLISRRLNVDVSKATTFMPVSMGAGFQVEFVEEEGAVLYLPEGASREKLLNVGALKSMVEAEASQWHSFARKLGRDRYASLVIVTMCDKTSLFATLTFSGASRSAGISATVSAAGLIDGKISWNFSSTNYRSLDSRIGPTPPSSTRNQCIFLQFEVLPDPRKGLLKWIEKQSLLPRLGNPFRGSTSSGEDGRTLSSSSNQRNDQIGAGSSNRYGVGFNTYGIQASRDFITETCGEPFIPLINGKPSTANEFSTTEPEWSANSAPEESPLSPLISPHSSSSLGVSAVSGTSDAILATCPRVY